jgi:hypothetical protein
MADDRRIKRLGLFGAGTVALCALAGTLTGGALARAPRSSDLVETAIFVAKHTVRPGAPLRVTDAVRNRGRAGAPASAAGYYLSRNRTRGPGDVRIGRRSIGSLQPGASSRGSASVRIPGSAATGAYRVLACADDRHRIRESDEWNNCRATGELVEVAGVDRAPPTFAGLKTATACFPGPVGGSRSGSYHLSWDPATDNVTPSSEFVYDVYQATTPGGEDFSAATYTSPPGATSFTTAPLAENQAYYFVVRATDQSGNRDSNTIEHQGINLCL